MAVSKTMAIMVNGDSNDDDALYNNVVAGHDEADKKEEWAEKDGGCEKDAQGGNGGGSCRW